ncbi:MAG: TonB-dependent receptor, partial [Sphingomonadales bacterium]
MLGGRAAARLSTGASGSAIAAAMLIAGLAMPAYAQETTDPAAESEEVVVTGFRAALESAVSTKRDSEQIVESVSAEDIGKLPDASIAESIARLPGLTSQRISGRSSFISIRGFGPDFSATLLNGRPQTSTNDNRGIEFDQYPSEVVSAVNVYKTPNASLTSQGLVGTVDIRTIRPLEYGKEVFAVGARGIYTDMGKLNSGSKDWGYRLNATYVGKFMDDRLGIALAAAYVDEPYQIEEFEAWGYAGVGGNNLIGGVKPFVT